MLEVPDLDTVLQMRPHKGRVEGDNHFPVPADHCSSDGIQDTICFLDCKCTLLAHIKFFISQDTWVLLSRATFKELFSQTLYKSGITPTQVQNLALFLTSLCSHGTISWVCQDPSAWHPFLLPYQLHHSAWRHSKHAEGALNLIIYVTHKGIKEYQI